MATVPELIQAVNSIKEKTEKLEYSIALVSTDIESECLQIHMILGEQGGEIESAMQMANDTTIDACTALRNLCSTCEEYISNLKQMGK